MNKQNKPKNGEQKTTYTKPPPPKTNKKQKKPQTNQKNQPTAKKGLFMRFQGLKTDP